MTDMGTNVKNWNRATISYNLEINRNIEFWPAYSYNQKTKRKPTYQLYLVYDDIIDSLLLFYKQKEKPTKPFVNNKLIESSIKDLWYYAVRQSDPTYH